MRPILFRIPGLDLPIYGYGLMLGIGLYLAARVTLYLTRREGFPTKRVLIFCLISIVAGVVGARLFYLVLSALPEGRFLEEAVKIQHSGRVAYGGYIVGVLAAIFAARWLELPVLKMLDVVAIPMILGLAVTRIGCFFAGCDYGLRSSSWGIAFPAGSPAWGDQVALGLLSPGADASLPVFPIQLVASLLAFGLTALLLHLWFRRPRRQGTVFLAFVLGYGLVRSVLEQFRGDLGRGTLLGLSTSTTLGLITAALALLALLPPLARFRPAADDLAPSDEAAEPDDG